MSVDFNTIELVLYKITQSIEKASSIGFSRKLGAWVVRGLNGYVQINLHLEALQVFWTYLYVRNLQMSEQKTVCHTHSANTNIKPMSAQLHQHRLLSEVNSCKFQVESSHLVVIALAVDWFEFVRMISNTIQSYAVFFFVL